MAIWFIDTNLNLVQSEVWKTIYPVGCLFETTDSVFNPQTHFGGTWELYGTGRVTVGIDLSDADFNEAGKYGGTKTHTLTEAQMPSHTHDTLSTAIGQALQAGTGSVAGAAGVQYNTGSGANAYGTSAKGGGQAHNNLQPYIVVKRWRRIA